jgi:hypothetical protein
MTPKISNASYSASPVVIVVVVVVVVDAYEAFEAFDDDANPPRHGF